MQPVRQTQSHRSNSVSYDSRVARVRPLPRSIVPSLVAERQNPPKSEFLGRAGLKRLKISDMAHLRTEGFAPAYTAVLQPAYNHLQRKHDPNPQDKSPGSNDTAPQDTFELFTLYFCLPFITFRDYSHSSILMLMAIATCLRMLHPMPMTSLSCEGQSGMIRPPTRQPLEMPSAGTGIAHQPDDIAVPGRPNSLKLRMRNSTNNWVLTTRLLFGGTRPVAVGSGPD